MNPFDPNDELYYFQFCSSSNYFLPNQTTPEDQNQIFHDPVIDHGSGTNTTTTPSPLMTGKGIKKQKQLPAANKRSSIEDDEKKKWMHKEIEKQRRQEMARLCTTFRSLLPLEYIKGKRSTSDHMHEGTKYIMHLEDKVKQLQDKRDELNKLSNSSNQLYLPNVIVEPCSSSSGGGGIIVQIECSYNLTKYEFPLSRLLDIVLQQGLDVIDCSSTRTDDGRFIHIIRSQDHDMNNWNNDDYTELQRKLVEAISSSSSNY